MEGQEELQLSVRRLAQLIDGATALAIAGRGVTVAEWALLNALYRVGAVAPSVLADAAGLSRGAVTKLVDRLRAKRLLVRAAGGVADRRFQTLALTGEGARLVREVTPLVAAAVDAVFAPLSLARRQLLHEALKMVAGPTAARAA